SLILIETVGVLPVGSVMTIDKELTILGPTGNPGDLVLDGGGNTRIFYCHDANVYIAYMTLQNGHAKGGNGGEAGDAGGGAAGLGGAVVVYGGTAIFGNVRFANNQAIGGNGGSAGNGFTLAETSGGVPGAGGGGVGGNGTGAGWPSSNTGLGGNGGIF